MFEKGIKTKAYGRNILVIKVFILLTSFRGPSNVYTELLSSLESLFDDTARSRAFLHGALGAGRTVESR